MAQITDLPTETLSHIFTLASRTYALGDPNRDLHNLSLVNKQFASIVQRLLITKLRIVLDHNKQGEKGYEQLRRLLKEGKVNVLSLIYVELWAYNAFEADRKLGWNHLTTGISANWNNLTRLSVKLAKPSAEGVFWVDRVLPPSEPILIIVSNKTWLAHYSRLDLKSISLRGYTIANAGVRLGHTPAVRLEDCNIQGPIHCGDPELKVHTLTIINSKLTSARLDTNVFRDIRATLRNLCFVSACASQAKNLLGDFICHHWSFESDVDTLTLPYIALTTNLHHDLAHLFALTSSTSPLPTSVETLVLIMNKDKPGDCERLPKLELTDVLDQLPKLRNLHFAIPTFVDSTYEVQDEWLEWAKRKKVATKIFDYNGKDGNEDDIEEEDESNELRNWMRDEESEWSDEFDE